MSDKMPELGEAELVEVPASEVSEQDRATLTVEYRDGVPVLVATDGTAIPETLPVVDQDGRSVGVYSHQMPKTRSVTGEVLNWFGDPVYHFIEPRVNPTQLIR